MAKKFETDEIVAEELILVDDISNADIQKSSPCNDVVIFKESNSIQDICILNKNFDLSVMPSNYMRRRSKIEEIIYRAIYSQNCSKSPFSSFKTASDILQDLNKIDIITGITSLKKVIKSAYNCDEQISVIVHKIGHTWLLDELDMDNIILRNHHFTEWKWLSEFIKQQRFQLVRPNVRRSTLQARDLFAKFLYHTVSQAKLALPPIHGESLHVSPFKNEVEDAAHLSSNNTEFYKEDYLNVVDWKLEDLSFVVGSDLSIFGTKAHPCISLRLSPSQEPISVLTGIDIWLENLLNEVPEVAMCYHNSDGIVQREYEILQTRDIPNWAGFDPNEVRSIARNLGRFLSTTATKEGHTYWLFKEAGSSMVKLYDLSSIRAKETVDGGIDDGNPFILPVAILCFRLAEQRIAQWRKYRRNTPNLTPTEFNRYLLQHKLADNEFYFQEVFRLLKNCINLLGMIKRHKDLYERAVILMCCLYLEMDEITLNCFHDTCQTSLDPDLVNLDPVQLKSSLFLPNTSSSQQPSSSSSSQIINETNLDGTVLYQHCLNQNTQEIFQQLFSLFQQTLKDRPLDMTPKESMVRNALLPKFDLHQSGVYISLCQYYRQRMNNQEENEDIVKNAMMILLLTNEIDGGGGKESLVSDVKWKIDYLKSFVCLHTEQKVLKNFEEILDSNDLRVSEMIRENNENNWWILRSVFSCELERNEDPLDKAWYELISFNINLIIELLKKKIRKVDREILIRSMSVLINFLVSCIVKKYQSQLIQMNKADVSSEQQKENLRDWCVKEIIPHLNLIKNWNQSKSTTNQISDSNILILNWSNQSRLCRLVSNLIGGLQTNQYLYEAIDSYSQVIGCSSGQSQIALRCDRLDVAMMILETAYGSTDIDNEDQIRQLKRSVELGSRILHYECMNSASGNLWKLKMSGLRLRLNYVKYFFNVKLNEPIKYEQILNDMVKDFNEIFEQQVMDPGIQYQELVLIMFYVSSIQVDKSDILTTNIIKNFLIQDCDLLNKLLLSTNKIAQINQNNQSKMTLIYRNFLRTLYIFLNKITLDSSKKKTGRKKRLANNDPIKLKEMIDQIESEFSLDDEFQSETLSKLIKLVSDFVRL